MIVSKELNLIVVSGKVIVGWGTVWWTRFNTLEHRFLDVLATWHPTMVRYRSVRLPCSFRICKWRISWVSSETKPEATDRLLASPLSPWHVLDSSRSTSSLSTLPSLQTPSTAYTCSWQDVASNTKWKDYSRMFLRISKHIGGTYIFDWYQGKQWSFGALCEQCGVAILHGVADVRATGADNLVRSYLPAGTCPLRVNLHSQQQSRGHDIP